MYKPELQSKILLWRQKCADDTMTEEEYKEAISELRQGRLAAAETTKVKKAGKKVVVDEDSLLEGL